MAFALVCMALFSLVILHNVWQDREMRRLAKSLEDHRECFRDELGDGKHLRNKQQIDGDE